MITEVLVPRINTNDDQVQILRWHINSGEYVAKGSTIVDLETSKTVISVEAECSGYLDGAHEAGKIIKVGSRLCFLKDKVGELAGAIEAQNLSNKKLGEIDEGAEANQFLSGNQFIPALGTEEISNEKKYPSTRFSKAAKKLIQEMDLKPENYFSKGLITSAVARRIVKTSSSVSDEPQVTSQNSSFQQKGPIVPREESLPLSKRSEVAQLKIGEQGLVNSSLSISFDTVFIRGAVDKNTIFSNFQALILHEIAQLLAKWPQFTAYYEADKIYFYDRVDLGLAIDLGMGLKVVRIKDAESFSISEISEITLDYCLRYMRNELQVDELVGSTITVTDLSSQNILYFHPLINGYQSAIIGIGGDSSRPEYPMAINMTFDHRVTTGREVALFLNELKENILAHQSIVSED